MDPRSCGYCCFPACGDGDGRAPFVIQCAAGKAQTAEEIIIEVMGRIVTIEHERGIKIDWESELPTAAEFTARDTINAMGRALTKAGIPNNLTKDE